MLFRTNWSTLLLGVLLFGNVLSARPDVGFNDTQAYLEAEYNEHNVAELKFKMNGVVPGIVLPNTFFNLQALRDFAKNFRFQSDALKEELKLMLGEDGDDFGMSFQSEISSETFLNELVRMLTAYTAAQ